MPAFALPASSHDMAEHLHKDWIPLPAVHPGKGISLESALAARRSVRRYAAGALRLDTVSRLMWAVNGATRAGRYRTIPSAGALYPLEIHLVSGQVHDLPAGVYRYDPAGHRLLETIPGDRRQNLCRAALSQMSVRTAPVVVVISAVFDRTTVKYGRRGVRYVYMEAGHAAQNLCLQAVALGLGTVVIGAFDDEAVRRVINLPAEEDPLVLIPVGKLPPEGG